MDRSRRIVVALLVVALAACAKPIKPPGIAIEKLAVKGVRITGLGLDVGFLLRNPNPDALLIERFDYELVLNGNSLGKGYYPETVDLKGFDQGAVTSRFDLNFLSLPGTIKAVLDQDKVAAEVKGTFYVRQGSGLKEVRFASKADVPIARGGGDQ
jgi:LEA14-like dessication related protein